MKLTNPYVAVQRDSEGYWQWRIECVRGFGPWYDHLASERAARLAGADKLRRWTEDGFERRQVLAQSAQLERLERGVLEDAFERRSRMLAEGMDIRERRHGRG